MENVTDEERKAIMTIIQSPIAEHLVDSLLAFYATDDTQRLHHLQETLTFLTYEHMNAQDQRHTNLHNTSMINIAYYLRQRNITDATQWLMLMQYFSNALPDADTQGLSDLEKQAFNSVVEYINSGKLPDMKDYFDIFPQYGNYYRKLKKLADSTIS